MTLSPIILYCNEADLDRMLSSYTVDAMTDDETTGPAIEADINDCLVMAAETVNMYAIWKYTPEMMATSNWVNRAATILAAYELRQRRNNECPEQLLERAEKIEDQLQQVLDGKMPIPGLPRRYRKQVVFSNIRVDMTYNFRCIRVEKNTSSPWSRTSQIQQVDYQDLFSVERTGG